MAPEDKKVTVAAVYTESSNLSADGLNTPPAPGQLKRSAT